MAAGGIDAVADRRRRAARAFALRIAGFAHFSFSDLPVTAPAGVGAPTPPSVRDIALQRAYVRAFPDRYVRGRRASLLDGPSRRWPQVSFAYRRGCCE